MAEFGRKGSCLKRIRGNDKGERRGESRHSIARKWMLLSII